MKLLSLIPSFANVQDGPTFVLTLQNDTRGTLDLSQLIQASALVLDGKTYPCQVVKFAGNPALAAGQTHALSIPCQSYLPRGQWKVYSPALKRWRWKPTLKSGKHTLYLRLGNAQIGPVEFLWDDTTPLLS